MMAWSLALTSATPDGPLPALVLSQAPGPAQLGTDISAPARLRQALVNPRAFCNQSLRSGVS